MRNSVINQAGFKPYLFAETHFERERQPIFVLAIAEQLRRLPINGCHGLSKQAKISKASAIASQHFVQCGGTLTVWGEISHYLFFYAPNRSVLIRPDGRVEASVAGLSPPKAELIFANSG